jgi:hypothetical protein
MTESAKSFRFFTKVLNEFLRSYMHAACLTHFILHVIILIVVGVDCKS